MSPRTSWTRQWSRKAARSDLGHRRLALRDTEGSRVAQGSRAEPGGSTRDGCALDRGGTAGLRPPGVPLVRDALVLHPAHFHPVQSHPVYPRPVDACPDRPRGEPTPAGARGRLPAGPRDADQSGARPHAPADRPRSPRPQPRRRGAGGPGLRPRHPAARRVPWPPLLTVALAANLACFADAGGPMRSRLLVLTVFSLLGGIIWGLFGLMQPLGPLPRGAARRHRHLRLHLRPGLGGAGAGRRQRPGPRPVLRPRPAAHP